ncbi:SMAD/FHA domain-containing protein [Mycena polygramma]|nr:SMAD/FHA domain-containing protein [Mycena polygramma]
MPAPMLSTSPVFPALYLYPLNDSFFIPKQVALTTPGCRVQLGRKTSNSLPPDTKQVNFDSSVISRRHAEVWQEDNKIFIRDTGSANGTFVNGRRLSLEGHDSFPYELRTNDIVELGTASGNSFWAHRAPSRGLSVEHHRDPSSTVAFKPLRSTPASRWLDVENTIHVYGRWRWH